MRLRRLKYLLLLTMFLGTYAHAAYPIESVGASDRKDFVVGPGKEEFYLNPGESGTAEIIVTNRLGETRDFEITVEDIAGSRDPNQSVIFLGDKKGPYSLKDYVSVPETKFTLPNNSRARIPVTIKVPANMEPGGLYGSVLISTVKPVQRQESENVTGGIPIQLREAVNLLVRVAGDAKEDAKMTGFTTESGKTWYSGNDTATFRVAFENNGSVHVDPSGTISVKNLVGEEVTSLKVAPWSSMPDSLRSIETSMKTNLMMGKYQATAKIYRGYGDEADPKSYDEMSLSFWVIPWEKIAIVFIVLLILVFGVRWFRKTFEFKRK
jgi:hypothetical protein